jgi:hypothetical protein
MNRLKQYDPQADKFVRFFQRCSQRSPQLSGDIQYGGALPVFIGRRRFPQHGGGFLDVLRRVASWVLPVALTGASTFLRQTQQAQTEGKSIGEAAKAALRPAAEAALGETVGQLRRSRRTRAQDQPGPAPKPAQDGSGPRKRRASRRARTGQAKVARVPVHVYKSAPPAGPSIKYNF